MSSEWIERDEQVEGEERCFVLNKYARVGREADPAYKNAGSRCSGVYPDAEHPNLPHLWVS